MSEFALRRAGPQDAPAVAEVWLASRRAAVGLIPPVGHPDADVHRWIASHVVGECECWVAETPQKQIIGVLALHDDWVEQLYIAPGRQRQGVGGKLIELAKRNRPDGLQLWVFASNRPARMFYERSSFIAVEETDGSGNEERAPDVRYVHGRTDGGPNALR